MIINVNIKIVHIKEIKKFEKKRKKGGLKFAHQTGKINAFKGPAALFKGLELP